MQETRPYVIGDLRGYSPQIARLVGMMRYARDTTKEAVQGLSPADLDRLHDPKSNTIGMLLLHIAAVEFSYQVGTFEERGLTAEERRRWTAALDLGDLGRREIRGHNLVHYLEVLDGVRRKTLVELRRRDDAWLAEERPFWGGEPANFHFMWFHVLEDELNHRGQIRWLRKRLGPAGL